MESVTYVQFGKLCNIAQGKVRLDSSLIVNEHILTDVAGSTKQEDVQCEQASKRAVDHCVMRESSMLHADASAVDAAALLLNQLGWHGPMGTRCFCPNSIYKRVKLRQLLQVLADKGCAVVILKQSDHVQA